MTLPASDPPLQRLTRFAPSPTGRLHLGHVLAAEQVWSMAERLGAPVLLRVEDIDTTRCRPAFETAMLEDLRWLGFTWREPVLRQSERGTVYADAADRLRALGLLYPCRCTRRDIEVAWGEASVFGPEGLQYPGTCRGLTAADLEADESVAWRLDMAAALERLMADGKDLRTPVLDAGAPVDFRMLAEATGDVVLCRRDIGTSYHLSVTVDDAAQNVTHVMRGQDMHEATALHRVLQALLDLPTPTYGFHPLIMAADGSHKLSKRDGAEGLAALREAGYRPAQVRAMARAAVDPAADSAAAAR